MKTPHFHNHDEDDFSKVEQEASEWVLKQDRGLSAEEQDALTDWLTADPSHKDALAKFSWGWDELDRLAGMHTVHPMVADEDMLAFDAAPTKRRHPVRWILSGLAVAASVAMFFSLAPMWMHQQQNTEQVESEIVYERIEKLQLEDGSQIELNHGSRVRTVYTEQERAIHLIEGEANFSVAKDPDRPFVVYVSGMRLCALGTVFNVRYNLDSVDLIVTEGRVQVLDDMSEQIPFETEAVNAPIIETSQRAIMNINPTERNMTVRQLDPNEIQEELLWRPELIDFNDEFLPVIVNDFNRRNRVQIYLNDPALRRLKLTSIFWSDNVEAFVRLLESNFKVQVERRNEFEIYLSLYS